jgi:dihydropteroate synthase
MSGGHIRRKDEYGRVITGYHTIGIGDCEIWGVLNVTPDSFSDGGLCFTEQAALQRGRQMLEQGAVVLDVGGESSRPAGSVYGAGAQRIDAEEEARRVVPVIGALKALHGRLSVDTVKGEVARQAIEAGATIVNDVSCGASDELLRVVANAGVELVLMHTRGHGELSEQNVHYDDVVKEVIDELLLAVERAVAAGVVRESIWIDPGIGFAKTANQSLELLARIDELVVTGYPVLVGPSRKSFIADAAPNANGARPSPAERVGGTAAAVAAAAAGGARAVRVHDVALMRQAALVGQSMRAARACKETGVNSEEPI